MAVSILKRADWFPQDGFPIVVERREMHAPYGLHGHDFSEIVIITSGRGQHVIDAESDELTAGDVFVISGARQHQYPRMENLCLVNILFIPEKLQLQSHDLHTLAGYHALFTLEPVQRRTDQFRSRLRLAPAELAQAMRLVDALDVELSARAEGYQFMAIAVFMQLVGSLSRAYAKSQRADSHALFRIGQALSHLEQHFHEVMELSSLARVANMSQRNFIRNFQAALGMSPIAYLLQLRINRAASLLRLTDQSVTEIAFRVGFADSNYFARQFRKHLGTTPSAYRTAASLRARERG